MPAHKRRVTVNRMVAPDTLKLLRRLSKKYEESEGRVLDRAVKALAERKPDE